MKREHVHPYVYRLDRADTGQYYFGFRCANRWPSHQDLGVRYFSSSSSIKEIGFEKFEATILAEFLDKHHAHDFESDLIIEHINDPLCLNKALNGTRCPIRKFTSESHRLNLKKALTGKKRATSHKQIAAARALAASLSPEERKSLYGMGGKAAQQTIKKMSVEERKQKFGTCKPGIKCSSGTREKLRVANTGKKHTAETRAEMVRSHIGKKQSATTIEKRVKKMEKETTIHGITYPSRKAAKAALGWSKQRLALYLQHGT